MSSITDSLLELPPESTDGPLLLRRLSSPVTAVAFWMAVAMPMAYLPLLLTGFESGQELVLFVLLLGVHFLALRIGRSHKTE